MQGWSPDFIPALAQQVLEGARIDRFMPIAGADALKCCRDLATREGIFVGISAGATFAGALAVAETAPEGANILCMLPDTGERYLSTPLFEDIAVDMTDEERDISRSTAGFRFDVAASTSPSPDAQAAELDPAAVEKVNALIAASRDQVVLFGLEWCEFCWSVRKVLDRFGIAYTSVDLDSVAFQADEQGQKMRLALRDRTGWNTFPQVFIGEAFVGGCTDLFDGLKDGSMGAHLEKAGIGWDSSVSVDPYGLLPGWLHPR